ncbi:uncharacterized protein LOC110697942 [Chenopodium quinoa]|uniref:uncharacterized protein LOC110697942 n=1 Tax=Chenopodium quinoa TaxID=63459 RepID=UPI000B794BAA|nr:uncharacterized protein LOC110697942 [Chenopodium quinoa]
MKSEATTTSMSVDDEVDESNAARKRKWSRKSKVWQEMTEGKNAKARMMMRPLMMEIMMMRLMIFSYTRIPAVGFPGLVNGQHMPATSTTPEKSGRTTTRKRGEKELELLLISI